MVEGGGGDEVGGDLVVFGEALISVLFGLRDLLVSYS